MISQFLCRLTGVYAFIVLLHMTLLGIFQVSTPQLKAAGPYSNIDHAKEMCQNVWWKNLLYVGIYKLGLDEAKYPQGGVMT